MNKVHNNHGAINTSLDRRADSPETNIYSFNTYVGPPYSWTKIYAVRVLRGSSSCRSIFLLRARARRQQQTRCRCCCRSMGQTDGRTDTRLLYDAYRMLHRPRNKHCRAHEIVRAGFFHRTLIGITFKHRMNNCDLPVSRMTNYNSYKCLNCGKYFSVNAF